MLAWKFLGSFIAVVVVSLTACGNDDKSAPDAGGEAGDTSSGGTSGASSAGSGGTGGRSGSGGSSGTGGTSGGTSGSMSGGAGGTGMTDAATSEDAEMPQGGAPAPGEPRDGVDVFFSGHSGFGLIMPAMVDQIAAELGYTHNYNLQMGIGSGLRLRLSGMGNEQDRDGLPLSFDVTSEISNATTIGGANYDTLVVTEALLLIDQLQYADSINQLRGFYDLLIESDANGRVFLFDMWESAEGTTFEAWASATREELVMWECLASAVNKDVANPIQILPGGMALIRAVEEAAAGNIPGVAPADFFEPDLVHPSPGLGNYYVALVVYASLYNRDPAGAPTSFTTPQGVQSDFISAEGAAALQAVAWQTVTDFYASPPNVMRSMAECRSAIAEHCEQANCVNVIAERFAD